MITLEERMEDIKERIYQAAMDEFDLKHNEEEIDELLDNNEYFDYVYDQGIWVEGFESLKFSDIYKLSHEDVLKIHNAIYDNSISYEELKEYF